jgi:hypothetical protein
MIRSWYAIGIGTGLGLALAHASAATAQPESRHHHGRAAFHRHAADHHKAEARKEAARREKDAKTLSSLKTELRDLRRQVVAVETMRHELTDLKEKIWGPTPLPLVLSVLPRPQSAAVAEPKQVTLKLPDFSEPLRAPAPVNPATASLPALIEERASTLPRARSAVEEAKAYLIDTATPGYTMVRQGADVAIGRLHPDFIIKLADAVRLARAAGLSHAGIYSAYRPPVFGVGGFGDKFNSLHSYGLAVDMTGIGSARSRLARMWQGIVQRVGLYLPYGPNNRAEFNHTQLVPTKMAPAFLRATITASQPKDLQRMWLASGISAHVRDSAPVGDAVAGPSLASAGERKAVLWAAVADPQAPPAEPQPTTTAPRRTRARRPGKRAGTSIRVAPRASGRKSASKKPAKSKAAV